MKMTINEAMAYLAKEHGEEDVIAQIKYNEEGFLAELSRLTGKEFQKEVKP